MHDAWPSPPAPPLDVQLWYTVHGPTPPARRRGRRRVHDADGSGTSPWVLCAQGVDQTVDGVNVRPRRSPSRPSARAVAAVIGPMHATAEGTCVDAESRDGVGDRRRRGEGDGVGCGDAAASIVGDRWRRTCGRPRRRRRPTRRRQPLGEDVASLGGTGQQDPPATGRRRREGLEEPLGDEAFGHQVGLELWARSAAAVPGPMAATRHTGQLAGISQLGAQTRSAPLGEVSTNQS